MFASRSPDKKQALAISKGSFFFGAVKIINSRSLENTDVTDRWWRGEKCRIFSTAKRYRGNIWSTPQYLNDTHKRDGPRRKKDVNTWVCRGGDVEGVIRAN